MNNRLKSRLLSLGILRQALLGAALVNMSLPILHTLLDSGGARSLWDIVATMIAPVMAVIFPVVILFDYVMSRVRAADAEGEQRAHFVAVGRIELAVMAITLLFWIPYLVIVLG